MNEIEALHTAARRYCIDHDAEVDVIDVRLLGPDRSAPPFITDNAETIALGAILLAVQSVVPGDFSSAHDLRGFLLTTGRTATAYPIQPHRMPREALKAAVDAAREAFCTFITGLSAHDLHREVAHTWFNRFRRLLIRWEKQAANYLGLVQLAACLIIYRKLRPARLLAG